MIHRGIFTLADFSGDDVFTWAPSAYYMAHHAYAAGRPLAYVSPLLWVLPTNIYPGSAGTVDGGLATLLHLQPYQFVEPFTAICLGLAAAGVYLLVRVALKLPRWTALLAMTLAATSQNRFVIVGFGFAQSSRGAVLMIGSLVLFVIAIREASVRAAVLSGAIAAVLTAVYMPLFLVLAASMIGGGGAVLISKPEGVTEAVEGLGGLIVGGLVIGASNVRWLLFDGGLHAWSLQRSYGTAVFFVHYPFKYLVGSAPFETLYRAAGDLPLSLYKPLFWNSIWSAVSEWVAVLALGLVCVGVVGMAWLKRGFELASLVTPILYGLGVFVVNHGGFGGFQSVLYVTPIGCVLAAYGVYSLTMWRHRDSPAHASSARRRGRLRSLRVFALRGLVLAVLSFQVAATVEMESFFVEQPGMMPAMSLKLSALAAIVPTGASVLMYSANGVNGAVTVRKSAELSAATYFLPGRDVTIEGFYFGGPYVASEGTAIEALIRLKYAYILHIGDPQIADPVVPSSYRVVWRFQPDGLVLYRRR